jgi:pimeloyl-ACP methyl ester carboxylesterase
VHTTYVLIPGSGGDPSYWDWVTPHLRAGGCDVIAVALPYDDDSAGLTTFCDRICEAMAGVTGPVVMVAQSIGAFSASMAAERRHTDLIVLINPMVPAPGETPDDWWDATAQSDARRTYFEQIGLPPRDFDPVEDFFHDVPDDVKQVVFSKPEPQSDIAFDKPWPLSAWPPVPTRFLQGADDRLFPLEFQRRLARERLDDMRVDVMPGGHLMALSRPAEVAQRLEAYRREAGL